MGTFDIIAIGGGSGGIATMNRAGEHGAKAAVIEEERGKKKGKRKKKGRRIYDRKEEEGKW